MKAEGYDFEPLLVALESRDDHSTRAEAERALRVGAIPTASTVDEAIALTIWRHTRDRGGGRFDGRTGNPLLVRQLRACADRGDVWAMAWIGLAQFLTWTAPASDDSIPPLLDQERDAMLRRAAAAGHRRAAFRLGLRAKDDEEGLAFLREAIGDGLPNSEQSSEEETVDGWRFPDAYPMTRDLLYDATFERAQRAAKLGRTDEAHEWFTRAAFCSDWESVDSLQTRSGARCSFALWNEQEGRNAEANAIWQLLLDEAARESTKDAGYMRSEWKKYRNGWQVARDRESARLAALRATWNRDESSSNWRLEQIAFLLCDNYFLATDDDPILEAYLATTPGGSGFLSQLRFSVLGDVNNGAASQTRNPDKDREGLFAVLWWLVRDFQSSWLELLGLGDAASKFRSAVDELKKAPSPDNKSSGSEDLGRKEALLSMSEIPSASQVIWKELLDDPFPRPWGFGSTSARSHKGWTAWLGIEGTVEHLEGSHSSVAPMRGTPLGVAFRLVSDIHIVKLLDTISFEIDQLLYAVDSALARRASSASNESAPRSSDVVQDHLLIQRHEFNEFVDRLDPEGAT